MRSTDIPEIRNLDLFASMSDENFDNLIRAAYLQTFPAQVELIREGDPADFLHVVIEGCVELFCQSNERESTMAMIKPVRTFILAAVLKDAVYLMSARTNLRSKILMIPTENILEAYDSDNNFSRSIVTELAGCYRSVVKEQKSLKLRSAVERLANVILRYHTDQGSNGQVELPYDKKIMASMLGMTPENLSRAFKTLKPYGVSVNGSTLRINDIVALSILAKPNPLIDDRQV